MTTEEIRDLLRGPNDRDADTDAWFALYAVLDALDYIRAKYDTDDDIEWGMRHAVQIVEDAIEKSLEED